MSAEHGSIEPILIVKEKQLRFSEAISCLEKVGPKLGTPANKSKPNFSLRVDLPGLLVTDKIGRLVKLGELRGRIGEKISKIRDSQSQFQSEIDKYLFDSGREIEMMEALQEQGLLSEDEVIGVKFEYKVLCQKLRATSLDQLIHKPEKPEKKESIAEEKLGNEVGLKIELIPGRTVKSTKSAGGRTEVYKVTYADGKTEEVAGFLGRIISSLVNTSINNFKGKSTIITDIQSILPSANPRQFGSWMGFTKNILKKHGINIKQVRSWKETHAGIGKSQEQEYYLAKMEDQVEPVEEQVQPEHRMTEEEVAMLGLMVVKRNGLQIYSTGVTMDDLTAGKAVPLLRFDIDEATIEICKEMVLKTKIGKKSSDELEKIRLGIAEKFKQICLETEDGQNIYKSQEAGAQLVLEYLKNKFEKLLGKDELCYLLTQESRSFVAIGTDGLVQRAVRYHIARKRLPCEPEECPNKHADKEIVAVTDETRRQRVIREIRNRDPKIDNRIDNFIDLMIKKHPNINISNPEQVHKHVAICTIINIRLNTLNRLLGSEIYTPQESNDHHEAMDLVDMLVVKYIITHNSQNSKFDRSQSQALRSIIIERLRLKSEQNIN